MARFLPVAALIGALTTGCFGYSQVAFPGHIQTIYIDQFGNNSFRRDLEFPLNEALVDAILGQSPYKIAPRDQADSILRGEIVEVSETVLTEDRLDDVTESRAKFNIRYEWKDRRTGRVLRAGTISGAATFVLSIGESISTATDESMEAIANSVVFNMQTPWDGTADGPNT